MNKESLKKQNGVVFTPSWVAKFMVDEIFKNYKIRGDEKILDAGCGDGIFTILATQKFAENYFITYNKFN